MSKKKKTQKKNPMKPQTASTTPADEEIKTASEEQGNENASSAEASDASNTSGDTEKTPETNESSGVDSSETETKDVESENSPESEDKAPEVEKPAEDERVDFASEPAGEYFAENAEEINIDEVKGTGKDGAVTKGDLEDYLKAKREKEKPAQKVDKKEKSQDPAETAVEVSEQDADVQLVTLAILEELQSFESPVRGALNTKPNVKERWNVLMSRANKLKKRLTK